MMKLQDVILKAIAKKMSWTEAADIAGINVRTMQRMRQAYVEYGYDGLFDQKCGKRVIFRVPMEIAERVLSVYQEKYVDFSARDFHKKLRKVEGIRLSYSWVKQALQGAGLVCARTVPCPSQIATRTAAERPDSCCSSTTANTRGHRTPDSNATSTRPGKLKGQKAGPPQNETVPLMKQDKDTNFLLRGFEFTGNPTEAVRAREGAHKLL